MTDHELLQAIGQVIEVKLEPVRQDIRELKDSVYGLEVRMDRLETKVDQLETRMDRLETKVDQLETRMDRLETKVDQLETRMDRLETKVDQLETKVDRLESRMDQLETRVSGLEENVHGIRVYLETEQRRAMNLLLEGQQALWDRFVPYEELDPLKDRTEILEVTVRRHSQEIRELRLA